MRKNTNDLTGKVFGYLTALRIVGRANSGNLRWLCRCICGKEKSIIGSLLINDGRRRPIQSCGCMTSALISAKRRRPGTAFRNLLSAYKRSAEVRHLTWSLNDDEFRYLVTSPCFYTGRIPAMVSSSKLETFIHHGIDRLDNSIGYTFENCVPCCSEINYAKHVLSYDDFVNLIREVVKWRKL